LGKSTSHNSGPDPTNENTHDAVTADDYLYSCGANQNTIDWERLRLPAERVLARLLVNSAARQAHLRRLESDNKSVVRFEDEEHGLSDVFLVRLGPQDRKYLHVFDLLLLLQDGPTILGMAEVITLTQPAAWKTYLEMPQERFIEGDRDDRAAARLLELVKMFLR
jgi:hypothetical protein